MQKITLSTNHTSIGNTQECTDSSGWRLYLPEPSVGWRSTVSVYCPDSWSHTHILAAHSSGCRWQVATCTGAVLSRLEQPSVCLPEPGASQGAGACVSEPCPRAAGRVRAWQSKNLKRRRLSSLLSIRSVLNPDKSSKEAKTFSVCVGGWGDWKERLGEVRGVDPMVDIKTGISLAFIWSLLWCIPSFLSTWALNGT